MSPDTNEELRSSTRQAVFAWTTVVLGSIDLVHLLPELVGVFGSIDGRYYAVVGVDVLVGGLGLVSGAALLRKRPWAWEPCAVFWGAGTAMSAIMLWDVHPEALRSWRQFQVHAVMIPRLIFYVFTVAASPFGVFSLLRPSSAERPKGPALALWLGLSALAGAIFITLVVLVR